MEIVKSLALIAANIVYIRQEHKIYYHVRMTHTQLNIT